jgi:hypothetical protein
VKGRAIEVKEEWQGEVIKQKERKGRESKRDAC